MSRMILVWLVLTIALGLGIDYWRSMTGKEQWKLTKTVVFATMCSLVAVVLLSFFVVLF
jgi:hypothetical protein